MKLTLLDPEGHEFLVIITYLSVDDIARVKDAVAWAREAHGEEKRKSGELFFFHPLTVAYYLAEYEADAPTLIAALLHDVAEDTTISIEEIEARFGEEVAKLVDGLTKFDKLTAEAQLGRHLTAEELKNATHYKLFDTMINDYRIGIIKIFDRLHNMRTMGSMPPHKQQEKARETLNIYAPLAYRLGMWKIKSELQELAIAILEPAHYKKLQQRLADYEAKQKKVFTHMAKTLLDALTGLGPVEVMPDQPDIFGTYVESEEAFHQAQGFDNTPRLIVLLKEEISCYIALGKIHQLWDPLAQQFDDYIGKPRDNLYRSLHTAVVYKGKPLKIRIRTVRMQIESQTGVLSKWMDRTGLAPIWSSTAEEQVGDMFYNMSQAIRSHGREMNDGVNTVVTDVMRPNQITVYTPKGDKRNLIQSATPLDFAYLIHTQVGHSCRGALVNERPVPLTHTLKDGDSVKILTYGSEPLRSWLDEDLGYLKTTLARTAVRRRIRKLADDAPRESLHQGLRILQAELHLIGLGSYTPTEVAEQLGYDHADSLCAALAKAELLPTTLATRLLASHWTNNPSPTSATPQTKVPQGQIVKTRTDEWFTIHNAGGRLLRLCQACNPRPGNDIIGFIRKDNSVTIHDVSCPRTSPDEMVDGRALKLRWGVGDEEPRRPIFVQLRVHDRDGLLFEITDLLRDEQINIAFLCSRSLANQATIVMRLEVSSPRQTVRFLHRTKSLPNIIEVCCLELSTADWQALNSNQSNFCPLNELDTAMCNFHMGK